MRNGTRLAAVDLGSNSFRLEIGRYEFGHIQRVEYLKETVRLGNGLDEDQQLTRAAMERGWACLARFGERLAGFPRAQVRAVATQTLREARNREEFLSRGSAVLAYPIDVVSGAEEARLIYQGVARLLPQSDERRLVVDIGGRSTELILGQQFSPQAVASYQVGSVAWSQRYFAGGAFSASAFLAAEIAAKAVAFQEALQPGFRLYQEQVLKNAKVLAQTLAARGLRIVSGGTQSHMMLVDLRAKGITGKEAEAVLGAAHMTINKNAIPNDPEKPMVTSGVRIGTPAMTTRGFKEEQARSTAELIADLLDKPRDAANIAAVRAKVDALTARFPVYG
ncbi:hypothetical protein ET532_002355 [Verminephrobacter sp. Larva24]|nr:hypothetical protein ET532_002355 [Verminephrobacter sp. Larva24]